MNGLLEAFYDLRDYNACNHCQYQKSKDCIKGNFCIWNDIEKELKALEILRTKTLISIHDIQHHDNVVDLNAYLRFMYGYKTSSVLTKEDFDLLNEVLL